MTQWCNISKKTKSQTSTITVSSFSCIKMCLPFIRNIFYPWKNHLTFSQIFCMQYLNPQPQTPHSSPYSPLLPSPKFQLWSTQKFNKHYKKSDYCLNLLLGQAMPISSFYPWNEGSEAKWSLNKASVCPRTCNCQSLPTTYSVPLHAGHSGRLEITWDIMRMLPFCLTVEMEQMYLLNLHLLNTSPMLGIAIHRQNQKMEDTKCW